VKKLSFIFSILKRRIINILLLSIMFSALLLIFMVGFSLKDIFYDYLRSGYGNIADLQVKTKSLSDSKIEALVKKIKEIDNEIDLLYGYEKVYELSITDNEDAVLTKEMPTLIKGLKFDNRFEVELDNQKRFLKVLSFEYDDLFKVEFDLNGLEVKDKDSLKFVSKSKAIKPDFCTLSYIQNNILTLESTYCKDNVDHLFQRLQDKNSDFINIKLNNTTKKLKIIELDPAYRTIVLKDETKTTLQNIGIDLEEISVLNGSIQSVESYDGELIITFKREENVELSYKRYIAQIVLNYINYNRFVLNVKHYAFVDEIQSQQSDKKELVYLNELTDFLDMLINKNPTAAIGSTYLAKDLNNLGVLDNFIIASNDVEFVSSIRSTFNYNPEKIYNKNILYYNKAMFEQAFNVYDKNNFLDLYLQAHSLRHIQNIKEVVNSFDPQAKFILQEQIIPSIAPKKKVFNIVVIFFSLLIFLILFISMYVVLRQFYSNFENELALLKLFGLNQAYQSYINLISFMIASVLIYFVLHYEESLINEIMMKYFFTKYDFEMSNYAMSLVILSIYILIIYMLERVSIKKLNIIKGE